MEFIYKIAKVYAGISVFCGVCERVREGREHFLALDGGIFTLQAGVATITSRELYEGDDAERPAEVMERSRWPYRGDYSNRSSRQSPSSRATASASLNSALVMRRFKGGKSAALKQGRY